MPNEEEILAARTAQGGLDEGPVSGVGCAVASSQGLERTPGRREPTAGIPSRKNGRRLLWAAVR